MPLSYWANMGLDADRIKNSTKPEDVQWSDQLGWTYRVNIKSTKKTIKKSQREVMTIVNARKRRGTPLAGPQPKAICSGQPTPTVSGKPTQKPPSSSSSSSSEEGEADDHESDPGAQSVSGEPTPAIPPSKAEAAAAKKKAKADFKAAAKAAAAKAKAIAKAVAALKTRATALRRRLLLALNGLRAAISHPLILDVPASMAEKVKAYMHAFERMVNSCDLVLAGAADELDEACDEIPWKEVKAAEKLLLAMLRNLAKARRLDI